MNDLENWLLLDSTLVTVVGPAMFFVLGMLMVPALRSKALLLVGTALAMTPISWLASWWGDVGFHVMPIPSLVFVFVAGLGKLNLIRHSFAAAAATWAGLLSADLMGSWIANNSGDLATQAWYTGVGAFGFDDALFQSTVVCVLAMMGIQFLLSRQARIAPLSAAKGAL